MQKLRLNDFFTQKDDCDRMIEFCQYILHVQLEKFWLKFIFWQEDRWDIYNVHKNYHWMPSASNFKVRMEGMRMTLKFSMSENFVLVLQGQPKWSQEPHGQVDVACSLITIHPSQEYTLGSVNLLSLCRPVCLQMLYNYQSLWVVFKILRCEKTQ